MEKVPKRVALGTLAAIMFYPFMIGMWVGHSLSDTWLQILSLILIGSPLLAAYVLPWAKDVGLRNGSN